MSKVQVIKAEKLREDAGLVRPESLRVVAYCRVSTDKEEQQVSFSNQIEYYEQLINSNPKWNLVEIYADEGISGTNTKNRSEFNRLIEDAKGGRFDMVITKSISRFARNTLDMLKFTRMLKDMGVAVYFENERINTMESSGEVMMTIFSSLAQDESRKQSESIRWAFRKGFQSGKVYCNTSRLLGYDKDEDGNLIINEEQANIVRRIYREYLEGKSYQAIADGLEADCVPTVTGNQKWWNSTVTIILTNEKYKGALLQQKTVTVDFMNKKRVKNRCHADQYYIEENHEAIIQPDVWEAVQVEKERRANLKGNYKGKRGKYSSKYPFSGKVICGDCGAKFKRRTWNSKGSSRKIVWQCKTYVNDGVDVCSMKAVDEKVLEDAFVSVFNQMQLDKDKILNTITENVRKVIQANPNEGEMDKIDRQMSKVKYEMKALAKLRVAGEIDAEVYHEEVERLQRALDDLRRQQREFENRSVEMESFVRRADVIIEVINSREELLEQFDKDLFNALVEKIEVVSPAHFVFVLKSGWWLDYTSGKVT